MAEFPLKIVETLKRPFVVKSIKVAPPSSGQSRYMTYEEKIYGYVDGVVQSDLDNTYNHWKATEPFVVNHEFYV